MNLKDIMRGLEILKPHFNDEAGYHMGAEHDQIYVYATDKPLPIEAAKELMKLGWFQPDTDDDAGYSLDDGWSCFV